MKNSIITWAVAGVSLVAAGCGASDEDGDDNAPPSWSDAVDSLVLDQGRATSLPFTTSDPENNSFSADVEAAGGITAEVGATELGLLADYSVSGAQPIAVTLTDDHGATSSYTINADVRPLGWLGREIPASGPAAREHGSLIVDEAGNRLILIGGSGYQPYGTALGDSWQFDLATGSWSMLTAAGDPLTPGGSKRVAQIPGKSEAYLWGGYGDNFSDLDELIRVEYSGGALSFKTLTQQSAPSARSLHGFFYDSTSDSFYAFGGVGSGVFGGPMSDLYNLTINGDVGTWAPVSPAGERPSGRYGFFYAYDQQARRFIVFSGAQGTSSINAAQDTWALDLNTDPPSWSKLLEGGAQNVPPGRRNGSFVFDPVGQRLFVFGGTADAMTTEPGLFVLDARAGHEAWSQLSLADEPPLRSSSFGVYDPASDQILLGFGNSSMAVYNDLNRLGY